MKKTCVCSLNTCHLPRWFCGVDVIVVLVLFVINNSLYVDKLSCMGVVVYVGIATWIKRMASLCVSTHMHTWVLLNVLVVLGG